MRNLTNTFENVSNRTITNSILTNSLKATLPLELTDDGTDNIISLKGLSNIGSASQYLRMNNAGTGLEFITLNLVDLNSTQTVLNKTFQNCSLNFNSNQHTNIGQSDKNVNINGFLNLNTGNDRAIIAYNADDNHSIFLRRDIAGVDNRISFYEWDTINFYTGNALNISAPNMPLRLSINQTNIRLLVNTTVSGTFSSTGLITGTDATYTGALQSQSLITQMIDVFKDNNNGVIEIFKSSVDNGNNNGTAKLKFSTSIRTTGDGGGTVNTNIVDMGIFDNTTIFRIKNLVNDIELQAQTNINLKKNDDTPINLNFYKGTNYVSLVANNALNSNITVKLPTTGGTLAILGDIPEATLPIFIDTTNTGSDKITLKGLNGIGNANQIIQVNANGDGFVYGNMPSTFTLTANQPLTFSNNILSLGGLTNYGSNGQVITSTGSGFTYTTLSNLTNADVLFLVRTQAEDISTFSGNGLSGFPATDLGHTSRNVNINCDVFLLNFVGATMTISNNSAEKFIISSSQSTLKNKLLISSSNSSLEALSSNLEIHQNSGETRLLINNSDSNANNNAVAKLFFKSNNNFASMEFTKTNEEFKTGGMRIFDIQVWNGSSNNSKLLINDSVNISKNVLLVSSSATSRDDNNTNFEVNNGSGFTKMLLKTTATNQEVELAMKNGNSQGNIKMLSSDNSLEFNSFSGYTFKTSSNDRFIINGTNISRSNLLVSNNSTGLETNAQFQVDSGGGVKVILKTTATDQDVELAFKNGNQQGQLKMLSSNSLDFQDFSAYTFNNYTKINYNNANSLLVLTSSVANCKIGLHLIQGSINVKLYYDYSTEDLVYESPASNATGQRFKINGQAPSIVDGNGRGLIFKTTTGNFQGVQVGNAVDKLSLNFGSTGSVFITGNNDLDSATFSSYNWYISAGSLRFQGDRNLVIYDSNNNALFASNTSTSDRDKKENIVDLEQIMKVLML